MFKILESKSSNIVVATFLLVVISVFFVGCNPQPGAEAATAGPPFKAVAGVKLLMNSTVDPQADHIWDSVRYILTVDGEEKIRPETDEEWTAVRNAAVTLAEAGNLLMMERRAMDNDKWMTFSRQLIDASEGAMTAADARDPEQLFDAGGKIYEACLTCHESYIQSDDYAAPTGPPQFTNETPKAEETPSAAGN